jgi:hypothetical protein
MKTSFLNLLKQICSKLRYYGMSIRSTLFNKAAKIILSKGNPLITAIVDQNNKEKQAKSSGSTLDPVRVNKSRIGKSHPVTTAKSPIAKGLLFHTMESPILEAYLKQRRTPSRILLKIARKISRIINLLVPLYIFNHIVIPFVYMSCIMTSSHLKLFILNIGYNIAIRIVVFNFMHRDRLWSSYVIDTSDIAINTVFNSFVPIGDLALITAVGWVIISNLKLAIITHEGTLHANDLTDMMQRVKVNVSSPLANEVYQKYQQTQRTMYQYTFGNRYVRRHFDNNEPGMNYANHRYDGLVRTIPYNYPDVRMQQVVVERNYYNRTMAKIALIRKHFDDLDRQRVIDHNYKYPNRSMRNVALLDEQFTRRQLLDEMAQIYNQFKQISQHSAPQDCIELQLAFINDNMHIKLAPLYNTNIDLETDVLVYNMRKASIKIKKKELFNVIIRQIAREAAYTPNTVEIITALYTVQVEAMRDYPNTADQQRALYKSLLPHSEKMIINTRLHYNGLYYPEVEDILTTMQRTYMNESLIKLVNKTINISDPLDHKMFIEIQRMRDHPQSANLVLLVDIMTRAQNEPWVQPKDIILRYKVANFIAPVDKSYVVDLLKSYTHITKDMDNITPANIQIIIDFMRYRTNNLMNEFDFITHILAKLPRKTPPQLQLMAWLDTYKDFSKIAEIRATDIKDNFAKNLEFAFTHRQLCSPDKELTFNIVAAKCALDSFEKLVTEEENNQLRLQQVKDYLNSLNEFPRKDLWELNAIMNELPWTPKKQELMTWFELYKNNVFSIGLTDDQIRMEFAACKPMVLHQSIINDILQYPKPFKPDILYYEEQDIRRKPDYSKVSIKYLKLMAIPTVTPANFISERFQPIYTAINTASFLPCNDYIPTTFEDVPPTNPPSSIITIEHTPSMHAAIQYLCDGLFKASIMPNSVIQPVDYPPQNLVFFTRSQANFVQAISQGVLTIPKTPDIEYEDDYNFFAERKKLRRIYAWDPDVRYLNIILIGHYPPFSFGPGIVIPEEIPLDINRNEAPIPPAMTTNLPVNIPTSDIVTTSEISTSTIIIPEELEPNIPVLDIPTIPTVITTPQSDIITIRITPAVIPTREIPSFEISAPENEPITPAIPTNLSEIPPGTEEINTLNMTITTPAMEISKDMASTDIMPILDEITQDITTPENISTRAITTTQQVEIIPLDINRNEAPILSTPSIPTPEISTIAIPDIHTPEEIPLENEPIIPDEIELVIPEEIPSFEISIADELSPAIISETPENIELVIPEEIELVIREEIPTPAMIPPQIELISTPAINILDIHTTTAAESTLIAFSPSAKPYIEKDALNLLMKYQLMFENERVSRDEYLNKTTTLITTHLQQINRQYYDILMTELVNIVDGRREHLELIAWLVTLYETKLEKDISNEKVMETFEKTLEEIKNSSIFTPDIITPPVEIPPSIPTPKNIEDMVSTLRACNFAASKITEIVDEYKINLKGNILDKSNYKILTKFMVDNFVGLNKNERRTVTQTLLGSMDNFLERAQISAWILTLGTDDKPAPWSEKLVVSFSKNLNNIVKQKYDAMFNISPKNEPITSSEFAKRLLDKFTISFLDIIDLNIPVANKLVFQRMTSFVKANCLVKTKDQLDILINNIGDLQVNEGNKYNRIKLMALLDTLNGNVNTVLTYDKLMTELNKYNTLAQPEVTDLKPFEKLDPLITLAHYEIAFEGKVLSPKEFVNAGVAFIKKHIKELNADVFNQIMGDLSRTRDSGRYHVDLMAWLMTVYKTGYTTPFTEEQLMQLFEESKQQVQNKIYTTTPISVQPIVSVFTSPKFLDVALTAFKDGPMNNRKIMSPLINTMISFIDTNFKNLSKKEIEIISEYYNYDHPNRNAKLELLAWIRTINEIDRNKELNYEEIGDKFIANVRKIEEPSSASTQSTTPGPQKSVPIVAAEVVQTTTGQKSIPITTPAISQKIPIVSPEFAERLFVQYKAAFEDLIKCDNPFGSNKDVERMSKFMHDNCSIDVKTDVKILMDNIFKLSGSAKDKKHLATCVYTFHDLLPNRNYTLNVMRKLFKSCSISVQTWFEIHDLPNDVVTNIRGTKQDLVVTPVYAAVLLGNYKRAFGDVIEFNHPFRTKEHVERIREFVDDNFNSLNVRELPQVLHQILRNTDSMNSAKQLATCALLFYNRDAHVNDTLDEMIKVYNTNLKDIDGMIAVGIATHTVKKGIFISKAPEFSPKLLEELVFTYQATYGDKKKLTPALVDSMILFIDTNFKNLRKEEIQNINEYMAGMSPRVSANIMIPAWIKTLNEMDRNKPLDYIKIRATFIKNAETLMDHARAVIDERIAIPTETINKVPTIPEQTLDRHTPAIIQTTQTPEQSLDRATSEVADLFALYRKAVPNVTGLKNSIIDEATAFYDHRFRRLSVEEYEIMKDKLLRTPGSKKIKIEILTWMAVFKDARIDPNVDLKPSLVRTLFKEYTEVVTKTINDQSIKQVPPVVIPTTTATIPDKFSVNLKQLSTTCILFAEQLRLHGNDENFIDKSLVFIDQYIKWTKPEEYEQIIAYINREPSTSNTRLIAILDGLEYARTKKIIDKGKIEELCKYTVMKSMINWPQVLSGINHNVKAWDNPTNIKTNLTYLFKNLPNATPDHFFRLMKEDPKVNKDKEFMLNILTTLGLRGVFKDNIDKGMIKNFNEYKEDLRKQWAL